MLFEVTLHHLTVLIFSGFLLPPYRVPKSPCVHWGHSALSAEYLIALIFFGANLQQDVPDLCMPTFAYSIFTMITETVLLSVAGTKVRWCPTLHYTALLHSL